jgi:sugar/nucleoside kinase (ribokinase family)
MIDVLIVGGIHREVLDGDTEPKPRFGGSGLTASVAAARFGAKVALAGFVGSEDEIGVRAELRVAGVDDSAVITVPGASGTFVFPARQDSEHPWPMYRPAEAVPHSVPSAIPKSRVVVVFGLPDFDAIAAGWLTGLGSDTTLLWDRQGWLSRARDSTSAITLTPERKVYLANSNEAIEDAGVELEGDALAVQPPTGFQASVIKRGIHGVVVIERTRSGVSRTDVQSFPVRAHSTIGSGDVFAGVLGARLSQGDQLPVSVRWGCAGAAVSLASGSNLLGEDAFVRAESLAVRS